MKWQNMKNETAKKMKQRNSGRLANEQYQFIIFPRHVGGCFRMFFSFAFSKLSVFILLYN